METGCRGSDNIRAMTPPPASAHRLLSLLVFAVAVGGPGPGCSGDGGAPSFNFAWDWTGIVGTGQSS